MPVVINDKTYYRTGEACRMIGISKNTLFRWLKDGLYPDVEYRDWRGWRLFTTAQLNTIRMKNNHVITINRGS